MIINGLRTDKRDRTMFCLYGLQKRAGTPAQAQGQALPCPYGFWGLTRLLAVLLIMSFNVLCYGQFAGGSGTEEDPWQIATARHLDNIRDYTGEEHNDKHFIQTDDIDLGVLPWSYGRGWVPIGNYSSRFKGKYDGNGFIIKNIYISPSGGTLKIGLFGYLDSATISNVGLINTDISGGSYVGGLAGYIRNSRIERCFSSGTVIGSQTVGNLIGISIESVISNSYSTGFVSARDCGIGGLVGSNYAGLIIDSYAATRTISVLPGRVGGLVGYNTGQVENSYWDIEVSGQEESAGGSGKTTLQMISLETFEDWHFEEIWGMDDRFSYPFLLWQENPASHNIPVPVDLRGEREEGTIYLQWNAPAGEREPAGYNIYRNERRINNDPIAGIQYDDTDITDWERYSYRVTAVYEEIESPPSNLFELTVTAFPGGSGTEEDPYLVATPKHLHMIRKALTAHYRQIADIDLDVFPFNYGDGWICIQGSSQEPFSGSFDGNGFIISNLIIRRTGKGLFRNIQNAVLTDIALENVDIIAGSHLGPLASVISHTSVSGSYVTGTIISTSQYVGGLFSQSNSSTFDNCWTDVDISFTQQGGSRTGGLGGDGWGVFTNCYALGNVTGRLSNDRNAVGGLLGNFIDGSIIGCYAVGNVRGGRSVGGLVGVISRNDNLPVITDSYAAGDVTGFDNVGGLVGSSYGLIQRSYSTGKIESNNLAGGLLSFNGGEVIDSFWHIDRSGTNESAGGTGLTAAQMMNPESFQNWDFEDLWTITEGSTYPWLEWQEEPNRNNFLSPVNLQAEPDHNNQVVFLTWSMSGTPQRYNIYCNDNLIAAVNHPVNNYSYEEAPHSTYIKYMVKAVFMHNEREMETFPTNTVDVLLGGFFPGGDGSEDNPYHVSSASDLNMIRHYLDLHFIQTADIELGISPWNLSSGWIPIGRSDQEPFTGSFDGNGFTISGLTINRPDSNNQALFGLTFNASLTNIGLLDVRISGRDSTAGLVGRSVGSTTIKNCFVTGSITGLNRVAGIQGSTYYLNEPSHIENCYSTATITVTTNRYERAGGIAASFWGDLIGNYATGRIIVQNETESIGAVLGGLVWDEGEVAHNYFNIDTVGLTVENQRFGTGVTTVEMLRQETFTGFDFDEVWRIDEAVSYPYFRWEGENASDHNLPLLPPHNLNASLGNGIVHLSWEPPDHDVDVPDGYIIYRNGVRLNDEPVEDTRYQDANVTVWAEYNYTVAAVYGEFESPAYDDVDIKIIGFAGGRGTEYEPYLIAEPLELWGVKYFLDKEFEQIADIKLNRYPWNYSEMWKPIGNSDNPFTGSYNGNFHSIEGLTIHVSGDKAGFFGETREAELTGIRLLDVHISGGISVGGLVGDAYDTIINECYVDGYVYGGSRVGGITGRLDRGSLTRSYATGMAEATNLFSRAGGLVGMNSGIISDCYSRMNVVGNQSRIGGLVGDNDSNNILRSFSAGIVTARNNAPSDVGGLAGYKQAGEISDSYWDVDASDRDYSDGGEGRTTEQMTYPYDDNTYIDWDFEDTWVEDITGLVNNGYPYLAWQINPNPGAASNPTPADGAVDAALDIQSLRWEYVPTAVFTNPAGFRVYFNETGVFDDDDDEYGWVDYIEGVENYYCSYILPERLESLTTYYWKVVPTTNEPGRRGEEYRSIVRTRQSLPVQQTAGLLSVTSEPPAQAHGQAVVQNRERPSPLLKHRGRLLYRGDAQDVSVWSFTTEDPTNIEANESVPYITGLLGNYPNPFNPETTISFSLTEAGVVEIIVFNIRGQKVATLLNCLLNAGRHHITWNGRDDNNRKAGSGVYLYRMRSGNYVSSRKMILLK